MNFTNSPIELPITLNIIYYVVGGIVFKTSSFSKLNNLWSRYSDLVVREDGLVLKNRGNINIPSITNAIQKNILGVKTLTQVIELTNEEFQEYSEESLMALHKVSRSVLSIMKQD